MWYMTACTHSICTKCLCMSWYIRSVLNAQMHLTAFSCTQLQALTIGKMITPELGALSCILWGVSSYRPCCTTLCSAGSMGIYSMLINKGTAWTSSVCCNLIKCELENVTVSIYAKAECVHLCGFFLLPRVALKQNTRPCQITVLLKGHIATACS